MRKHGGDRLDAYLYAFVESPLSRLGDSLSARSHLITNQMVFAQQQLVSIETLYSLAAARLSPAERRAWDWIHTLRRELMVVSFRHRTSRPLGSALVITLGHRGRDGGTGTEQSRGPGLSSSGDRGVPVTVDGGVVIAIVFMPEVDVIFASGRSSSDGHHPARVCCR